MFTVCSKPVSACKKAYTSGHSFDDVSVTEYEAPSLPAPIATSAGGQSAPQQDRARARPAPAPRGVFASCAKPEVGADALLDDGDLPPPEVAPLRPGAPKAEASNGAARASAALVSTAPVRFEDPGYALLEAGDSDEEEFAVKTRNFVRQFSEVNKTINNLQFTVAALLVVASVLAFSLMAVAYEQLVPQHQRTAQRIALLASIPIVACLFTWFHIWMAIQMMFRPLDFVGLCEFGQTGMGVGWQGVVPRKAARMASMGYTCARPYIQGPRDIMGAVDPKALVAKTRAQLALVLEGALAKVGAEHFPLTDRTMGDKMRRRIAEQAVDRIIETCPALWHKYTEILSDTKRGIDNDGMFVKVFTENKVLLNNFFLSLGEREFRFIEHCGAVMGFVCGVVQLIAFNNLSGMQRDLFLPVTGFFLGIFSNWLAIQMVFRPVWPIPVRPFGYHIYTIQGLFIKRQPDVCVLYSKMVVDNFLNFDKIVEYMMTQPELWQRLKEAYLAHNTKVMRESMGFIANIAPLAFSQDQMKLLEDSLKDALVDGLYKAKDIHRIAAKYIGKVTRLEEKNCHALQQMPPDKFENLLHPIFQEDEWILVLLGGVLGVIVGLAQIWFLT